MPSVTELLDRLRRRGGNAQRKKKPSGRGDGKWETNRSLAKYRVSRDAKKKSARAARKRNRR